LRRFAFAAAVVSLIAAFAAPAAHARPARDIGAVALHPWQLGTHQVRERVFSGIAASGVRWARVDMPWTWVEEHGPTVRNGHGHWSSLDNVVHAADRHGIKLIGIVAYTPKWASDSGDLWAYPDSDAFEDFFAAALRRYPQIPAWELWNEPNFERFSKPWPSPGGFVEFLRAARQARDSVGSSAKLISGGIAPGGEIDVMSWVNEVAMRGGLQLIDGFGFHPYSPAEPDDPRSWMMQLEALHKRLAQLGRPDLPLWLTEFGAPSVPVASGYAPAMSEAEQADRLRLAFALASRFDWIENLTWYEYRDSCTGSHDPECNFGLVHSDLSPKPALTAMREVMAGAMAKLRPQLTLSSRMSQARVRVPQPRGSGRVRATKRPPPKRKPAKRRRVKRSVVRVVNRITISGKLMLPGTAWPSAPLTVRLPRRVGPPLTRRIVAKEGIFWARFEGRDLASGPVVVTYGGDAAYHPLTTQVQVAIAATKRR
jgi:polysaccharide biosynthesis protein PslG